jgi:hypothetical protein
LPWRSAGSISKRSGELLELAEAKFGSPFMFDALLSTSTIPDHPFNAVYFHKLLTRLSLAHRDQVWTTYLNERTAWAEEDSMI